MNSEEAKKKLYTLISEYEEHREQYLQKGYDETEFRNKIIDRFFWILGWDVDNDDNLPEYNRDVIRHYKLKTKYSTTKPDYAFGLLAELKPLFFVEAKTPSTFIKDHKDSAHQTKRYGRSAGLAVSILTNFEEFAVYDCTKSPRQNDAAGVGRIDYITYTQYLEKFDFLWDTFSKEAVRKGRFDKFIQTDTKKKGSVPPDKGFVEKLNEWREDLATNIGLNNKRLNEDDINFAVQLIIDRIIFLRFCEDRNIEHFGNLLDAAQKGITQQNLVELFTKADEKYNSGLFDFSKDTITPKLKIDNKILKNIIDELYRPKTEYEFGVMPVEILGNAYEQFLGHIIKITPSGRAKIDEKPEVKKAGGVFYTPQYIVEYIVENTVGKLIKEKTPKQINEIKIVDPACGSGSFLLGAYICLLKHHSEYYWTKGLHKKKSKNSPLTPEGKLTVAEKKRILINNIFGVDIDPNAVEVTKLSLLLKAMDGETEESIYQQLKMFHQRALPDLDDNIKCGNSLIGYDFFDTKLELDKEEQKALEKKLKPFDWKTAFKKIFNQGGFDAVIGNPPYRTLLLGKKQKSENEVVVNYYQSKFPKSFEYKVNLFALFIEKSIRLIKNGGLFSFIIPNALYTAYSFNHIRKHLLVSGNFNIIYDLRYRVFRNAEIGGNGIFVFTKGEKHNTSIQLLATDEDEFNSPKTHFVMCKDLLIDPDHLLTPENEFNAILKKIRKIKTIELGSITKIYQGIITGDNDRFLSTKPLSSKWQKILRGKDINRYYSEWRGIYVYYSPKDLWSNSEIKMFKSKEKLISRQTSDKLIATIDTQKYFTLDSTHVIHLLNNSISIKYLLALFNSKLLNYIYKNKVKESGRVFAQVKVVNIKPLPIREIDFNNKQERNSYDEIINSVDTLLELNKDLRKAKHPDEKIRLQNRIKHSENRIDELVYKLYGLNKKEIETIEKNLPQ